MVKPDLDFIINGYMAVRQNRVDGTGGGCVPSVKEDIPCRTIGVGKEMEYVVIEVWAERKNLVLINFYNSCKKLELNGCKEIEGVNGESVLWCGDFNAHNTL